MLTIRLQRVGRKNDPSFRVILVEKKRAAKTGQFMEVLGNYNARTGATALKADEIKGWIKKGVTVSDNVHNLLINNKVIDGKKKDVNPKKTVEKVEAPAEEAAAPAEAPTEAPAAEVPVGDNEASA